MWDLACLAKVFLQQEAFWVIPLRESRSPLGEGKALFTVLLLTAAFHLDAKS